jgi:hypothetical protein
VDFVKGFKCEKRNRMGRCDTKHNAPCCDTQEKFDLDYNRSWTVELDSSTPAKFSRHLIIRIPGAAFQNNFHVGAFVKEMCAPLEDGIADSRLQRLLVNKVCAGVGATCGMNNGHSCD